MIRGLYNTANALEAAAQNHEVVASNLAYAQMPGYRRREMSFEAFNQALSQATDGPSNAAPTSSLAVKTRVVFEPGELLSTGHPLDLAVRGEGFFVLEGPNGPLYTRNGVLQTNAEGELQNASGLPVAGSSGRISIPSGTSEITVWEDGTVLADKAQVGQIKLAHFKDPARLTPVGTTLFEAPKGIKPDDGTSTVHQGFRESSNVEPVHELVRMIAGMRQYEASQRVMRAISEAIQQNTNPQAR